MCLNVLLECMYAYHMCTWYCGSQKRALDPLKIELWMVVNYCVGPEN